MAVLLAGIAAATPAGAQQLNGTIDFVQLNRQMRGPVLIGCALNFRVFGQDFENMGGAPVAMEGSFTYYDDPGALEVSTFKVITIDVSLDRDRPVPVPFKAAYVFLTTSDPVEGGFEEGSTAGQEDSTFYGDNDSFHAAFQSDRALIDAISLGRYETISIYYQRNQDGLSTRIDLPLEAYPEIDSVRTELADCRRELAY